MMSAARQLPNDEAPVGDLEAAYRIWSESGGRRSELWDDLLSEQVNFRTVGQPKRGFSFAYARQTKREVVNYLTRLTEDWDMVYFRPERFLADGPRVAMMGMASWRNRATGRICEVLVAHFWRFRDGRAVEIVEVFDSFRVMEAMTPEG